MRIATLITAVLVGATLHANAMVMIVTKKGEGVWATTARMVDNKVIYISRDTGAEKSFLVSEIDGVVPKVSRGKQYKPKQIQKYIDRIKKLRAKHRRLLRGLNELLQEWELLQRPSPELEGKIDAERLAFQGSDKGTDAFKRSSLSLWMIKYKDLQGKYTERIDKLIEDMRSEYIEVNMKRLVAFAEDAPRNRIDVFVKARNLGRQMARISVEKSEKATIPQMVDAARKRTFDTNVRLAYSTFTKKKTIDAYLSSGRILDQLKKEVASTDLEKTGLDKRLNILVEQIAKKEPSYDFSREGFPMSSADMTTLRKTHEYSSRITFSTVPVELECYVLPVAKPKRIRFHQGFTLPIRLIFRRAQPKGRNLVAVVMLREKMDMHRHMIKLDNITIKNGYADINFREDFRGLDSSFVPVRELEGGVYYYVYIAYLARGSEAGEDAEWQAISATCAWPTNYR